MPKYSYQPVAGALVWNEAKSLQSAAILARHYRKDWPQAEVERVLLVGFNGKRYWRWRNGKWTTEFWRDPTSDDLARWSSTLRPVEGASRCFQHRCDPLIIGDYALG